MYKRTASNSVLAALLMLTVGFLLFSADPTYWPSSSLILVMRVGGLAMLAVAIAAWRQSPLTFRLDTVCSGLIFLSTAVIGVKWVIDYPHDLIPYVLLLFALMCSRSARDSYRIDARLRAEATAACGFAGEPTSPPAVPSDAPAPAEPAPPPDGYLAELGRNDKPSAPENPHEK